MLTPAGRYRRGWSSSVRPAAGSRRSCGPGSFAALERGGTPGRRDHAGVHPMTSTRSRPTLGPPVAWGPRRRSVRGGDQNDVSDGLSAPCSIFFAALAERARSTGGGAACRSIGLGRPAHPCIRPVVERGVYLLKAMDEAWASGRPSKGPAKAGWGPLVEPGLVELLVSETRGEPASWTPIRCPSAPPKTWAHRRKGRTLTVAGYHAFRWDPRRRRQVCRQARLRAGAAPSTSAPIVRDSHAAARHLRAQTGRRCARGCHGEWWRRILTTSRWTDK